MSNTFYDELRGCIRKKITAQKDSLASGETSFRKLVRQLNKYAWECFAELGEKELDPSLASVFAELTLAGQENAQKLIACTVDFTGYLAEKQKIDEEFRKIEMGDHYKEYREQLKAKQEERKQAPPDEEPPPILVDLPADWKKKILDFVEAIRIRKGACPGVHVGPPIPVPIWPKPMKIYPPSTPTKLECTWKPVPPVDGCNVTYNVQIQPQVPAPTGNIWYYAHKTGPYIAFGLTKTSYTLDPFEGFYGRWRVWAVDGNGRRSDKSSWQYFFFPIKAYPVEPELSFTFAPNPAKRGQEVQIIMNRPEKVTVYFDGRPLPKKTSADGKALVVTVPGDATSGYFELKYNEHSVQASQMLIVLP